MEEAVARKLQKSLETMRLKVISKKNQPVEGLSVLPQNLSPKIKVSKTKKVISQ